MSPEVKQSPPLQARTVSDDQSTIDSLQLLGNAQLPPPPPPDAPEPPPVYVLDRLDIRFSAAVEHPPDVLRDLPLAAMPTDDWEQVRLLRDNLWEAQENGLESAPPFSMIGIAGLGSQDDRWALSVALWASHRELVDCRVLLIDTDASAAPSLATPQLNNAPGLVDLLYNESITLSSVLQRVQGTQLYLISPGTPTAGALDPIDFRSARPILAQLRKHFDFVFFHLPDRTQPTDLSAWTRLTDGVVLTCKRQSDTYQDAEALLACVPSHKALGWAFL